jgi:uncharacterized protein with HEPN domain
MSEDYLNYIQHINDECTFILSACDGFNKEAFVEDEIVKRAIVRSLEIIGEASKKIPVDYKLKWNNIQWKNMAGMRDRLIHDYQGVNYSIVWDVVKNKIPELQSQVKDLLGREKR